MTMLTALFGTLRELFGKAYLLTGLIPAAFLTLAWGVWTSAALPELGKLESLSDAAFTTFIQLAVVSILFFAGRQTFLRHFEGLPGPLLAPLRVWLTWRQVRLKKTTEHEGGVHSLTAAALKWASRRMPPQGRFPAETGFPDLDETRAAELSARARSRLAEVSGRYPERLPDSVEREEICEGVRALFHWERKAGLGLPAETERAQWQGLLAGHNSAGKILRLLEMDFRRRELAAFRIATGFPREEVWMLPTTLGNRIAMLDDYAKIRYGITTSTLWNRLSDVIDKDDREAVNDAQLFLQMSIGLCVATAVAFLLASIDALSKAWPLIAAGNAAPDWRGLLFLGAAALLVRLFYGSAVAAFDSVVERVTRIVDLQRGKLIENLGYETRSAEQERRFFQSLEAFFTGGKPTLDYWEHARKTAKPHALEDRLQTVRARDAMRPAVEFLGEPFSQLKPKRILVSSLVMHLRTLARDSQLILSDKNAPLLLVSRRVLETILENAPAASTKMLTLADVLRDSPALEVRFRNAFATLGLNASLWEVHEAMQGATLCLDVLITGDGTKNTPVLGWIDNEKLAGIARSLS